MGAQLKCNINSYQKSDFTQQMKKNRSLKNYDENIDLEQQYDNPSRGKLQKILNKKTLIASNNLLKMQTHSKNYTSSAYQKPQTQRTSIQYQINDQFQLVQFDSSISIQQTSRLPQNINDIASNIFFNKQNDPIQSFKQYVLSSKSLYQSYQKIQIHHQDFIKFKKQPITNYYRIQSKLGQGSYGKVYKGICIKSNQIRAIKSIKQKIMQEKKKKQLKIEIDTLSMLDHPNIIKLFQIYQQKSMFHVVTQYCTGGSIVQLMMKRKKYNQKIVRNIMRQILSALTYMHRLKIVHRDLKLQNIVMLNQLNDSQSQTEMQNFTIKLIDFGTAIKIKKKINQLESLVGTTSYMAPEIVDKYFNQKCDIWSAGIIFYILLVGRSPFKCVKKQDTLNKIRTYQLKFQDPQFRFISSQAIDLIKRMLTKNPQKRISAADALSHSWFQQSRSGRNLFFENKSLVQNLQKYYRGNNFISKIQSYLTYVKVTQQQRKKISQQFMSLDINQDGNIQISELKTIYKQLYSFQSQIPQQQLQHIILKVDKNKSGKIDLQQFTSAVYDKKKLFCREYLLEAFQYFDTNGTGFIEGEQLRILLNGCEKEQIEQILKDADLNRDRKISKEEFLSYMEKMNVLGCNNHQKEEIKICRNDRKHVQIVKK